MSEEPVIWTNTNFRHRSKWSAALRAAGLEGTTIHDLRHTAASLLIAAGADAKSVQHLLGHATASMTMDLYGHLFSDAPWRAMSHMPTIHLPSPEGPAPNQIAGTDESPSSDA